MLGVSDKCWLIEMFRETVKDSRDLEAVQTISIPNANAHQYSTYFGLGHRVALYDRPGVFKVSLAGISFGAYLLKGVQYHELAQNILDVGTGSGVLALLLRSMGARDITATDVCKNAVQLATENELLNFDEKQIHFYCGNLFAGLPKGEKYATIIFNPPGWRTPSSQLLEKLRNLGSDCDLVPEAMFFGDQVLLQFLKELPAYLHKNGRALVGLNSLVGIQDVFSRYRATCYGEVPVRFRLLERHSLPLLLYSPGWKQAYPFLREEFRHWQDHYGAAYTIDSQGNLYWSYEVVECILSPSTIM